MSLLSFLAVLFVVAAVADVALNKPHLSQAGVEVAFGLMIAVGEAIRIALPHGREAAPLATAASFGLVLCVSINGQRTTYGASEAIAVVSVATLCGVAVQAYAGRQPRPGYVARRIVVSAIAALFFLGWLKPGPARWMLEQHDTAALCILFGSIAVAAIMLDHLIAALLHDTGRIRSAADAVGGALRRPARPAEAARRLFLLFRDDFLATARVCPTVTLFAVAIALSAGSLGVWVLPITAAPVLMVQLSLRKYSAISATYQQTIRALSRVTDLAEYTEPGHARRVCRLAKAIGRDLSLSESELLDLEYAALLHDIGQLSLTDPVPGGATVLISPQQAASVAARGADVVRQTGVLDRVAEIIRLQAEPFRAGRPDEPVALAAGIIRAANAYDDLVGGALDPDRRLAALRRIRLGTAVEYDPRVVESLTRIVEAAEPYPGG
jgi:hypothetical protein